MSTSSLVPSPNQEITMISYDQDGKIRGLVRCVAPKGMFKPKHIISPSEGIDVKILVKTAYTV